MSSKTLSNKQTMAAFGVSHVTLFNWRRGTATRDPLSCHKAPEGAAVEFRLTELKKYAKRYGLEFKIQPEAILADPKVAEVSAKKPPTAKKLVKSNPSKRAKARTAKKPS